MHFLQSKVNRLYIYLAAFFLGNAVVADFMGVKIFSLEDTLGMQPFVFHFFGEQINGFSLTCGVILWPIVFIMSDIINEYFGTKGVQFLSWLTAGIILYAYIMLYLAMHVSPAQWWLSSSNYGALLNYNDAFNAVFGQGSRIIIASLIAFLVGQIIDVAVFHYVKRRTGEKYIWLRSTGSTLVSQLIDSYIVLFCAFYLFNLGGKGQWSLPLVLAVGTVNYIYKFTMAIVLTPLLYIVHAMIERYLGPELAHQLKQQAADGLVHIPEGI